MLTPTNRRPNRIGVHLIRIALVATFTLSAASSVGASGDAEAGHGQWDSQRAGAAGNVEESPSGDGAEASVTDNKATPILFGVRIGTAGSGDAN
jgi:hypothetical protein